MYWSRGRQKGKLVVHWPYEVPTNTAANYLRAVKKLQSKEGALSKEKYEPGDMISTDQFIVRTPGRKLSGYGREGKELCYQGGTLYADAASRLIRVEPQVSLGAGETVNGKAKFEEWIWSLARVLAKHYHSDNGIFASEYFRQDVINKKQTQSFSGVGAQHQNAHAERDIQTISYWARSMMVHASIHWPSDKADDIRLWAFAVKHAAWLYNRLPQRALGFRSPLEVFTKTKSDHRELLRAHVWGCPVFVLDPKLQDGKKLPKFNRRARMGQFVGFSDEHSSLVAKVRNLSTNFISPQFHVIFDDKFTTIQNDTKLEDTALESIFTELFETCRDYYGEEPLESDSGERLDELPELNDEWLNEAEQREKKSRNEEKRARQVDLVNEQIAEAEKLNNSYDPVYPILPTDGPSNDPSPDAHAISDDESSIEYGDNGSISSADGDDLDFEVTEGVDLPPSPQVEPVLRRSRRLRREYNPGTEGLERHPDFIRDGQYVADGERLTAHPDYARGFTSSLVTKPMKYAKSYLKEHKAKFALSLGTKQPPRRFRTRPRKKLAYQARLFRKKLQDANTTPHAMNWEVPTADALIHSDLARFVHFAASDCGFDGSIESLTVNWLHPLMLSAKASASSEDNPNWWKAMNGPFAEEYWEAACLEVMTLEDMDAWDVVDQTDDMNVLPSTWAFKAKRFPDGLIKKFKARFCARGDKQIEGVDYFVTYAPVVQWTTIRLMLILECVLDLKSKQGDVTCAFLHAKLPPEEKVYLEMPRGFKQYGKNKRAKVLSLKRTLYGLRQSPRAFWKYMVEKLEICGMKQSDLDPCLFIGPNCIAVMYVDDILMWSTDVDNIYSLGERLREAGVDLEEEGDAAGFLGVKLSRVAGTRQLVMTQEGLITRVLDALGLDNGTATPKNTPCIKSPLSKDVNGDPVTGAFNYPSVVGMLLYLAGHSRPDISYAVSCAARFCFAPRHSHEVGVKMIGRYLLATRDKGLVMNPSDSLDINAYPDADFAGMWGTEDPLDPISVKSRAGFVINVADCPVLWKSSLMSEIATSTMEAETVLLAMCCRELFPVIDLVEQVGSAVGLPPKERAKMHVTIHEDNAGALILAKTIPPQATPRSKHYAIKTHWFREQIIIRKISIIKCPTLEQLGDIFTKCIPQAQFEYLRKKLMGW